MYSLRFGFEHARSSIGASQEPPIVDDANDSTRVDLPALASLFSNTATAHGRQTSRQAAAAAALATTLLRRCLLVLHGRLALGWTVILPLRGTILSLRRAILALGRAVLTLGGTVRLRNKIISNCDQGFFNAIGYEQVGDAEGNRRHRRHSNLEQTWYR